MHAQACAHTLDPGLGTEHVRDRRGSLVEQQFRRRAGFSDGLPVAVDDGMNDRSVDECLDDAS
jgi:hypothetical protein